MLSLILSLSFSVNRCLLPLSHSLSMPVYTARPDRSHSAVCLCSICVLSLSTPHTAAASGSLNTSAQLAPQDVAALVETAAKDHNDDGDVDVDVDDNEDDTDSELSDSTESSHSTSLTESEGSR